MNQNPIIKALQDELAKECEKLAEVQAFQKGNAHTLRTEPAWHYSLIDFNAGHEAATARFLGLLEKAVEVIEDVAKMHPDANPIFRIEKAREFLTTLADASSEMNKEKQT